MPRYVILAEGKFDYLFSKTGNTLIRYKPDEVVAVIDSTNEGKTASDVLGYGGCVPIVADLMDSSCLDPDTLLIGIAPPGGQLPEEWRQIVRQAIAGGLNIVSGLHTFLSDDDEFNELAKEYDISITDLRKPPDLLPFSKGSWRWRKSPVLLTVGTDCDVGKMTAAWELKMQLEEVGKRVTFIGTGQTGILLGGFGVAVDAVVSDFVAGAIEAEIDKAAEGQDLIIVEGQGAINHMAYSGVTLGLLHGTMPDMMIMCHEAGRELDTFDHPIPPITQLMDLHLHLIDPFKKSSFVGISLMTLHSSEDEAREAIVDCERTCGIPASDFVRFGSTRIASRILEILD